MSQLKAAVSYIDDVFYTKYCLRYKMLASAGGFLILSFSPDLVEMMKRKSQEINYKTTHIILYTK